MDTKEDIYVLIDKYLHNRLSEAERKDFEQKCAQDPQLAQALKLQTQAEFAVRTALKEERRAKFNQEYDRLQSSGQSRAILKPQWIILSAAAIIIILLLIFRGNLLSPTPTPQKLFAANYEPMAMDVDRAKSSDSGVVVIWREATEVYNRGEFERAISLIEQVIADSSFSAIPKARLYLGLSYLQVFKQGESEDTGQLQKAIAEFGQVSKESLYRDQAGWYEALAYLATGDKEMAKKKLEVLLEYGSHYKDEEIRAILEDL
jgi:hypothetical protein